MKLILMRNILIALCICCISCGNSSANSKQTTISESQVYEIVQHSTDSLSEKFNEHIKSISQKLEDIKKNVDESKKKQKGFNHTYILYFLITIVILSVVWLLTRWNKVLDIHDRIEIEEDIKKLENKIDVFFKRQQDNIRKENTIISNYDTINLHINNILNRLLLIEEQLKNKNMIKDNGHSKSTSENVPSTIGKEIDKEGYFGIVKGKGIFNDIFYSKQDECKFKVWFKSKGNEAEFEPIDLNRIRSVDGIEKAIDINTDEISLQEAHSFVVTKRGKVRKNGEIWEVEIKGEILLKK